MSHASRRAGRRLATLGLAWGVLLASTGPVRFISARQATPATGSEQATCDVAPRAIEDILNLTAITPAEDLEIGPLPEGDPADSATTAAITTTLEEMAACLTAGQMLRFYALHSDDWLRRFAARVEGLTTLTISTPPLDDGDRAAYLGPWRVQALPDGRVMAVTLLRVGDELRPDPGRTRVLVFVERDGRWLVDETIEEVQMSDCEAPVEVAAAVGPPPGAVFDEWAPTCAFPAD